MLISSRGTAAVVLALCTASGLAVTVAGCGGSPAASAGAPGAKAGKGAKAGNPAPASVISCLNSHGMSLAAGATTEQVKSAFTALPVPQQQRAYSACGSLLPVKFRQRIQARLTITPSPS